MADSYNTCADKSCCDQCQTCDNCDGGAHGECNTKQNFCSISSQNAAIACGFSNPWGTINHDDIIIQRLPRERYNSILDCIRQAYNKGSLVDSGKSMNVSPETGNYITAQKTNEIMNAINGLNGQVISGVPNPLIADKHIVYASYFNSISNGLMSMRLLTKQCDACNSQCDATCDTCDACDTCDTGACYTCVACNSCNSVTTWSCSQWSCSQWSCSQWSQATPPTPTG